MVCQAQLARSLSPSLSHQYNQTDPMIDASRSPVPSYIMPYNIQLPTDREQVFSVAYKDIPFYVFFMVNNDVQFNLSKNT